MLHNILVFFLNAYRFRREINFYNYIKLEFKSRNLGKGNIISIRLKKSPYPFVLRARTSDNTIFKHIFLIQEYPPYKIKNKHSVIIDAGANIGAAAFYFKCINPEVPIFVIEPDAGNMEILRQNLSHFSFVTFIQAGLHSEEGVGLIIENPEAGPMGYRLRKSDNSQIKSVTINQLIKEYKIGHIGLAKIDIEGGEENLFSKNHEWLSKCDYMVLELHDHYAANSSNMLIRALATQNVQLSWRGENLICNFIKL